MKNGIKRKTSLQIAMEYVMPCEKDLLKLSEDELFCELGRRYAELYFSTIYEKRECLPNSGIVS